MVGIAVCLMAAVTQPASAAVSGTVTGTHPAASDGKAAFMRLQAVDHQTGAVLQDSGLVPINATDPVDPEGVPVGARGDVPVSAGLTGALAGSDAASIDFYHCIYTILERLIACFTVPTQWSWSGGLVNSAWHAVVGNTYWFFWKYVGKTVDTQTPSIVSKGAVHILSGGEFCYDFGVGPISKCVQNWTPTFDITLGAGWYQAYAVSYP